MMAATPQGSNVLSAKHGSFLGGSSGLRIPRLGSQVRKRGSSVIQNAQDLLGTVVSTKMEKTCVVTVKRMVPHPRYHKLIRTNKRYLVHDEDEIAKVGDYVRLVPTRPLSKHKHFAVDDIVKKAL